MSKNRRIEAIIFPLAFVPLGFLAAGFLFVNHAWPFGEADYERYREFWGGNPSEVFSHWLDMVVLSGNAFSLGWFLTLEAFVRQRETPNSIRRWLKTMISVCVLGSVVAGAVLDSRKGEGTVLFVSVIGFLPVLGSSYYLLRKAASFCRWLPNKVIILSALYVALNLGMQLFYEPSGTGGPNALFILVWLGSIASAAVLALGLSLRSGSVLRFASGMWHLVCKPFIWGSAIVLVLGITIPLTIHARHLRQPRQAIVLKWLDDIESSLSDDIVRELKKSASSRHEYEKMPIPQLVRALLEDSRIRLGNSLRIYVPVDDKDYLFLWANKSFGYCDVRPLNNSPYGTVEIDQGFIDSLRQHQGTYESSLYSIIWSPYLAGRVLKSRSGEVKAICLIKSPD